MAFFDDEIKRLKRKEEKYELIDVLIHAEFKDISDLEKDPRGKIYKKIATVGWIKVESDKNTISTTWYKCFKVNKFDLDVEKYYCQLAYEEFCECAGEFKNKLVALATASLGVYSQPLPKNIEAINQHILEVKNGTIHNF